GRQFRGVVDLLQVRPQLPQVGRIRWPVFVGAALSEVVQMIDSLGEQPLTTTESFGAYHLLVALLLPDQTQDSSESRRAVRVDLLRPVKEVDPTGFLLPKLVVVTLDVRANGEPAGRVVAHQR